MSMRACTCVCIFVHMEAGGQCSASIFAPYLIFYMTELTSLARLVSASPIPALQIHATMLGLYLGAGGPNSVPHAHMASTLPTSAISPAPVMSFHILTALDLEIAGTHKMCDPTKKVVAELILHPPLFLISDDRPWFPVR